MTQPTDPSSSLLTAIMAMAGMAESQIQEQITWSRETHAKVPFAQWLLLAFAVVMLQLTLALIGLGAYGLIIHKPALALLWLLILPIGLPSSILGLRIAKDLRSPFWRRSPMEADILALLQKHYTVQPATEPNGERILILRSKSSPPPNGARQEILDRSQFAEFVARLPHRGTHMRAWEPDLGRQLYQHYRDRLIEAGYAEWHVYRANGQPAKEQGWDLVAPVREILAALR